MKQLDDGTTTFQLMMDFRYCGAMSVVIIEPFKPSNNHTKARIAILPIFTEW